MYRLERSGTPFRTEPFRCTVLEDKLSLSYYTSDGMDSNGRSHTPHVTHQLHAQPHRRSCRCRCSSSSRYPPGPALLRGAWQVRRSRAIPLLVWSERFGTPIRHQCGPRRYRVDDCYGRGPTGARHNRAAFLTFGSVRSACRHVPVSVSGLASGHTFHGPLRPPFPTCRWLEQGNLVYPGDPEKASAAASSGYWLGPFFSSVPRFRHWGFSWPIARPGAGRGRGGPSSRQDVRAQPDSGQCPCATFDDLCEEKGHPAARAAHGCCDEGR